MIRLDRLEQLPLPQGYVLGFEDQDIPYDLSEILGPEQVDHIDDALAECAMEILETSDDSDHIRRAEEILERHRQRQRRKGGS